MFGFKDGKKQMYYV